MPTKVIASLKQKGGRTVVEPKRPRQSVSKRIGAEKAADRKAKAWAAAARGGRVTIYRRRIA